MNKSEVPALDMPMSGIKGWVALNAARNRGFISSLHEQWTSDKVDITTVCDKFNGELLWEDSRQSVQSHDVVYARKDSVISLTHERREISAAVYATSLDMAEPIMAQLVELMPRAERTSNLLDVTFWYYSNQHGPLSYDRQLEAPIWKSIETNYPVGTRKRLVDLQKVAPTDGAGKLILWQGEPGTGKTFALRSLGEERAEWCRVHYVLDPERFFTEGDYLLRVILGSDSVPVPAGQPTRTPWRLVVLEDAGEMLAKDAKQQVGQGLSRLLNLCDGLLGQGLRVLVLITTNEQVGTLNAAVSRPGRCLSHIVFEKFDSTSANEWLQQQGAAAATVTKQAALADLYALAQGLIVPERAVAGFK